MRIEELNMFLRLVKNKSISETARQEHFTQPAVSSMLSSLERQLDVLLFERNERQRSPLVLTPEGEILNRYAETIVNTYQFLKYELVYQKISPDVFTIGSGRSFSVFIFPSLVNLFKGMFPKVNIAMQTYPNTQGTIQALVSGECDIILSSVEPTIPGLVYEKLMEDPFLLVCPLDMEIPSEITPRQMLKIPFIMREKQGYTYEQVSESLIRSGVHMDDLNIIMTVYDNSALKQAIELGVGCGFVPRSLVINSRLKYQDCKIVSVKALSVNRSVFLVRRDSGKFDRNMQLFWSYAMSGKWGEKLLSSKP